MRKLFTAAVAMAALAQFAVPARAEPDFSTVRMNQLLQKLVRGDSAEPNAVAVAREGKIRVKGTIAKVGSFSLPLYCSVYVSYYDGFHGFHEYKSQAAEFEGKTGECTVTVPYKWKIESDAELVEVRVELTNQLADNRAGKAPSPGIGRGSEFGFDTFALPAEGGLKVLTFEAEL